MHLRSLRGFTLIELLVVIAIIGILGAIIMPRLLTGKSEGRDAQRISQLRQIRYALELYYNTNGRYPACLYSSQCPSSLQTSGFLPSVPKDPNGANYSYTAFGSGAYCSSYHLGVSLESIPNSALSSDADKTIAAQASSPLCSGTTPRFSGLSAATNGAACATSDLGNGANNTTETCYDLVP